MKPCIVLFRNDLRLDDNEALYAASELGCPIIPIFIMDETTRTLGTGSYSWLSKAIAYFENRLNAVGLKLICRRGRAAEILKDVITESGADKVFYNRSYEPNSTEYEASLARSLEPCQVCTFRGNILVEPWLVLTQTLEPYQVFTPFYRRALQFLLKEPPKPAPIKCNGYSLPLKTEELSQDFGPSSWAVGEQEAFQKLQIFDVAGYDTNRNYPALASSNLSPHIHFGEISVRRIAQFLSTCQTAETYIKELFWRDFAHYVYFHFPRSVDAPLRREFSHFPWREDPEGLKAWQQGVTGFPIVDAAMRQLQQTGWMHNRARMIVGSFLVKDLLVHWKEGERWFWNTLIDADICNNTLGWQWVSGCGVDAAPYFRIFNPVLQGEKFDPDGEYVKRFVPELASLPSSWIHKPHLAPQEVLASASIVLGKTYPYPIIDHAYARRRALDAFESIKK